MEKNVVLMQKLYAGLNPFKLKPLTRPITNRSFEPTGLEAGIIKQLGIKSMAFRKIVVGIVYECKKRHYHKQSNDSWLSYQVNTDPVVKKQSRKTKFKNLHTTQFVKMFESTEQKGNSDLDQLSHTAVMPKEILMSLQPKNNQVIVDATFGAGGHAKEILRVAPDVRYFAADRDPVAHRKAVVMASDLRPGQIVPILCRFSELPTHLQKNGVGPGSVDAFLFDLGASSMQFDSYQRGFSLIKDGPLDMRMDGERFPNSVTAADVVNNLDAADLANILKKYGEEKLARQIAQAIVDARYAFGNFTRTKQLAEVVTSVFESGAFRHDKMHRQAHMATKTFQALRIFVNNELNEIHAGLLVAAHFLRPGSGVCAALAFHSLEDRIIKRHFHGLDLDAAGNQSVKDHFRNASVSFDVSEVRKQFLQGKCWQPLSKKVACPTEEECLANPRARSAKLRAATRLVEGQD